MIHRQEINNTTIKIICIDQLCLFSHELRNNSVETTTIFHETTTLHSSAIVEDFMVDFVRVSLSEVKKGSIAMTYIVKCLMDERISMKMCGI
jgi:hypothetical protein